VCGILKLSAGDGLLFRLSQTESAQRNEFIQITCDGTTAESRDFSRCSLYGALHETTQTGGTLHEATAAALAQAEILSEGEV